MLRAQHAQALEKHGRMLEEHVVVEIALLGRHDHPRRTGQCGVEALNPHLPAGRDARAYEILAIERQHDVHLRADVERGLDENQICAACGRGVHDRQVHLCQALANRSRHGGDERGREAGRGTIGRVDHVTGEGQHVGRGQDFEHFGGARDDSGEQGHLPAHGRNRSGIVSSQRAGRRVALAGAIECTEQQGGLTGGGVIPAAGRRGRQPGRDFGGEALRPVAIAEQSRQGRRVDTRIGIPSQRVGGQVLIARPLRERGGGRRHGSAREGVFPEPTAQAQDV